MGSINYHNYVTFQPTDLIPRSEAGSHQSLSAAQVPVASMAPANNAGLHPNVPADDGDAGPRHGKLKPFPGSQSDWSTD